MMLPTAVCNGATLRMARWTDPSDLAMVRDAFYTQKRKSRSSKVSFDAYAPVLEEDEQSLRASTQNGHSLNSINLAKRKAVERVQLYVWHDHRVPHALVATAALVDAQLHYEEGYHNQHGLEGQTDTELSGFKISSDAMKSIFAMSFCRFVNGFVDRDVARRAKAMRQSGLGPTGSARGQNSSTELANLLDSESSDDEIEGLNSNLQSLPKSVGESSMYKHALTIDMPTSFVDLRHKATHGRELPSIDELRKATEDALAWLWDKWWKVNAKGDATIRSWEAQQWEEALAVYQAESRQSAFEKARTHETSDQTGTTQHGRWETVSENGVTRFVYVSEPSS